MFRRSCFTLLWITWLCAVLNSYSDCLLSYAFSQKEIVNKLPIKPDKQEFPGPFTTFNKI